MSIAKKMAVTTVGLLLASLAQAAGIVYQTGTSDPWGVNTNETAMDNVFGSGNWSKSNGFDIGQFSGASFVFLEGGDTSAIELANFLTANKTAVESYVSNGGHLFINAAPNGGSNIDFNFGVTLTYIDYSDYATVTAAGVAAGLTAGGISTTYSGTLFGHATVSGGGISDLVHGDYGTVFGGKSYGSGYVAFGGQTTTNFHWPEPDAGILRENELRYIAAVPEPETYAMFGAGLGILAFLSRRKRSAAA